MTETPPPFDIDAIAGVMAAYMRYSIAQQQRDHAAGEEPPVVEGNAHNEFLRPENRHIQRPASSSSSGAVPPFSNRSPHTRLRPEAQGRWRDAQGVR
jgi:hypothetical protein